MKTRKIVLLSACAILFCICIIQGIVAAYNPVKTLEITETPDYIEISGPSSKIELSIDGSTWYVGHDNFQAEKSSVDNMIKTIKEIKVLDTVAKLSSNEFNERYDLNDGKAYIVTAKKGDKVIRTLKVGKASSTGSQSYISVDNSKNIYLVSGNLQTVYNKTEDSLKTKTIYNILSKDITSVNISSGKNIFTIKKDTSTDSPSWKVISGENTSAELDNEKIDTWLNQISTCSAITWVADSNILPKEKVSNVEIETLSEKFTIDIYKENNGSETKYICTSNKTPHHFELSETSVEKYKKSLNELKK